jgi:hypothetical protein
MPRKRKQDVVADSLLRKEKRDQDIKFGFDLDEFFKSRTGHYFEDLIKQQQAINMKDTHQAKYPKKHPKEGEYMVQSYEDLCTMRGFTNGLQWVLELIEGKVNKAKRLDRERRKEEKEASET